MKCGRMCSTGTYLNKCRQFSTQGFPLRNLFPLLFDLDAEMDEQGDCEEDKEGHRKGGHALRKNLIKSTTEVIILLFRWGWAGDVGAFEKKELRNA
jgi:hypothetical protein